MFSKAELICDNIIKLENWKAKAGVGNGNLIIFSMNFVLKSENFKVIILLSLIFHYPSGIIRHCKLKLLSVLSILDSICWGERGEGAEPHLNMLNLMIGDIYFFYFLRLLTEKLCEINIFIFSGILINEIL